MSQNDLLALLQRWRNASIDQVRPWAAQLSQRPWVLKAGMVLVALRIILWTNRALTNYSLNNWTRIRAWSNEHELVLVTGGCSGIGKQIVSGLAERGVRVVVLDIQEPVFSFGTNVTFYHADVTSSESIRAVAQKIRASHGEPTVLVNNAGVGNEGTLLAKSEARIRQTFEINTISHFLMVREFLPAMIKQNHGHIVTIASTASFMGMGEMMDYSCSKASALAFHEGLSEEIRSWYKAPNIRTSIIHPNWVRTPMITTLTSAGDRFRQPILTPKEVADAVVKQILAQKSGQVVLPGHLKPLSWLRALPFWIQGAVRGAAARSLKSVTDWQKQTKQNVGSP
ncbi:hydroxysteroid 17-beta dehydrogenase 11 [Aspergillus insuetus]